MQPDGKIVVAGLATTGGATLADGDFALARYNTDGTLDHELRRRRRSCSPTSARRRTSPVPWPSSPTAASSSPAPPTGTSRSCATPTTARSTTSFGDHGTRVTDFGSDDFANGVALTGDGHILVAGHTLGAGLNLDFALARYTADGELDTRSARRHRQDRLRAATTSPRT